MRAPKAAGGIFLLVHFLPYHYGCLRSGNICQELVLTMPPPSTTPATTAPPTIPFTILEPQNPWIGKYYVVQERCVTDFKAPKV